MIQVVIYLNMRVYKKGFQIKDFRKPKLSWESTSYCPSWLVLSVSLKHVRTFGLQQNVLRKKAKGNVLVQMWSQIAKQLVDIATRTQQPLLLLLQLLLQLQQRLHTMYVYLSKHWFFIFGVLFEIRLGSIILGSFGNKGILVHFSGTIWCPSCCFDFNKWRWIKR